MKQKQFKPFEVRARKKNNAGEEDVMIRMASQLLQKMLSKFTITF